MIYNYTKGNEPILTTAIHNGHELRNEVQKIMALSEEDRLREEDPYTGALVDITLNNLVVHRSRFEVDLNRPREKAVYILPEDAWGLEVWSEPLPDALIARSLQAYDRFYSHVHKICTKMEEAYGHFVVLDLHSYNHRRPGGAAPPENLQENPDINLGTGTLNRNKWAALVDRFMQEMHAFDYRGRNLDVRENVKFKGGQLVRYINESFPRSGCALAVEFKKFFMDEWTGEVDEAQLMAIREALQSTVPGIIEELAGIISQE